MMKFTPGPWVIKHEFNVMDSKGRSVAACGGQMQNFDVEELHAEKIANAHLIAVAPEMYELLEQLECTEYIHSGDTYCICPSCGSEYEHNKDCRLKLLLRKARGE